MDYLLDTDACIALINGSPAGVRAKLHKAVASGERMLVSTITVFELWYGVAKSSRCDFNRSRVETFLAGPINVLSLEEEDAAEAGLIRAALKSAGKPIGAYDVLIAGQAVRNGLTLITANVAEFSRVKNLLWEDWGK